MIQVKLLSGRGEEKAQKVVNINDLHPVGWTVAGIYLDINAQAAKTERVRHGRHFKDRENKLTYIKNQ